jgi:hypothetical protein
MASDQTRRPLATHELHLAGYPVERPIFRVLALFVAMADATVVAGRFDAVPCVMHADFHCIPAQIAYSVAVDKLGWP